MERTEQMYTLQKQLEFGKKKVKACGSGGKEIFWGVWLEGPIPACRVCPGNPSRKAAPAGASLLP